MGYGYFEFGDQTTFVSHDGARQRAMFTWETILREIDREARLAEPTAPAVEGFAPVVRSLILEPDPDGPDHHASLAQLALYAASFTGRAARRTHDAFGPQRLTLAAGKAEFAAAAHIGVQHWALEHHTPADQERCELATEDVWMLTAMMAKSIAHVAPLLLVADHQVAA